MRTSDLIELAKKIIADRMILDYFSRLQGTVIFRQYRENISDDEVDDIQRALLVNGVYTQLQVTQKEYLLRLIAEFSVIRTENRLINLGLLIATFLTTTLSGAMLVGYDPFTGVGNLLTGLPYALSVLAILGAHEMGHYLYAVRYKIYATLPYFIPFFLPGFSFGTFGAFIKIKSPIPNKKALFDVGIAGPIAGFVVSLVLIVFGMLNLGGPMEVRAYVEAIHPWSENGSGALTLGGSLLFDFLRQVTGTEYLPMYEVYHFPMIFAGWIGLLVTALNLMPIGQLDGGHISYALFGKNARYIAIAAFIMLALLNFYSTNWLLWTILILFVIRLQHPPTMNDSIVLDKNRRVLGWFSYLIFITCFSPMPIYFG